jgi:hypothetical protein
MAPLLPSERARWSADIKRDFPSIPVGMIEMMLECYERDPKAMRDLMNAHKAGKVPKPPKVEVPTEITHSADGQPLMRVLTQDEVDDLERRRQEALEKLAGDVKKE